MASEFGKNIVLNAGCADDAYQPQASAQYPPLVLAYVGDSVYELFVRGMIAQNIAGNVHKLHTKATEYARSESQADVIKHIFDELTESERDIVRRGRNVSSGYVPKNASVTEYRYATGFEALLGHLYLNREFDRLDRVLHLAAQRVADRAPENHKNNDK